MAKKGSLEQRFGLKPGDQVPLHVANILVREQQAAEREVRESALDVATGALEDAFADDEKPRSGRRSRKNLRAPVKTGESDGDA